jgi:hypothetical protein
MCRRNIKMADTYRTPLRLGMKNLTLRYSVNVQVRTLCFLELPRHPAGATLCNFVSWGKKAKSPANSVAKPNVKLSSIFSLITITWQRDRITVIRTYRCAPLSTDSVSTVSVIRGLPWLEKRRSENQRNKWFICFTMRARQELALTWWNPSAQTRPVFDSSSFALVLMLPSSGYGGQVVCMLASGTQVRGFKLGWSCCIFRVKNSSACLPSEGK